MAAAFEWPADGGKRRVYEQLFAARPCARGPPRHAGTSSSATVAGPPRHRRSISSAATRSSRTSAPPRGLAAAASGPRRPSRRFVMPPPLHHHAAVLVASVDGRGLYRRLGFREYGILRRFTALAPIPANQAPPTFEGGDARRVVLHNAPRARWSGNAVRRPPPAGRGEGRGGTDRATEGRHVAQLASGPLEFTLRRSTRARRLRVVVDPIRGVLVTLPTRRTGGLNVVEGFLAERETWLRRHLDSQAREWARLDAQRSLGPTGAIRYLGEIHRLRIVADDATARRSTVLRVGGGDVDELHLVLAARDRRPAADVLRDLAARPGAHDDRARDRAPGTGAGRDAGGRDRARPADAVGERGPIGTPVAVLAPDPRPARGAPDGGHPRAGASARVRPRAANSGHWSAGCGRITATGGAGFASTRSSCTWRSNRCRWRRSPPSARALIGARSDRDR